MRSYGEHKQALDLAKLLHDPAAREELRQIRDDQALSRISDVEAAKRFVAVLLRLQQRELVEGGAQ